MRCKILRASDDYVLNVRDTDEIGEDRGMTDREIVAMVRELRTVGRFWLDAETLVMPVRK